MNTIYNATKKLTSEFSMAELFFGIQYIQHEFDEKEFVNTSNIFQLDEKEIELYSYLSNIQSKVNKKTMEDFVKSSCLPIQWILGYQIESTKERNGYVLVLDHSIKSLCLYINGTQNFTDLITDIKADSIEFLDGFAHKGMLHISNWFMENLKDFILDTLKINQDYNFYIIGHSLGAGVASILSIRLIEFFPKLKCIGFACPSCLSENLSKQSSKYIINFINQNDFVPRFSIYSIKEMKKKLPDDWIEKFREDVKNTESSWMKGLKKAGAIDYLLKPTKKEERNVKLPPIPVNLLNQKLYPVGRIIHFYEIENELFLNEPKLDDFLDLILIGNYVEDHKMIHYFEKFEMLKLKLSTIKNIENFDEKEEKLKILKLLDEKEERLKKEIEKELIKKEEERLKKEEELLRQEDEEWEKINDPFEEIKEEELPPLPKINRTNQILPPIPLNTSLKMTNNLNKKLPPPPKVLKK